MKHSPLATYRIINNKHITHADTFSFVKRILNLYSLAITPRSVTIGATYIDIDLAHCTVLYPLWQ